MKLSRLFVVVVGLLVLAPAPVLGQQPTQRVSIGVGVGTIPDWMNVFSNVLQAVGTLGTYQTVTRSEPMTILAQYEHFLDNRFALLGATGLQRISRDVIVTGDPKGTLDSTYGHLMGGAAIHFRRNQTLSLYSNVAGGIALNHDTAKITGSPSTTESEVLPAFQVTLLGLRVGQPFGAFLELGAGYRGMVVLGASYEF